VSVTSEENFQTSILQKELENLEILFASGFVCLISQQNFLVYDFLLPASTLYEDSSSKAQCQRHSLEGNAGHAVSLASQGSSCRPRLFALISLCDFCGLGRMVAVCIVMLFLVLTSTENDAGSVVVPCKMDC